MYQVESNNDCPHNLNKDLLLFYWIICDFLSPDDTCKFLSADVCSIKNHRLKNHDIKTSPEEKVKDQNNYHTKNNETICPECSKHFKSKELLGKH